MSPEVSNIVGTLITELGLMGSRKDQLQRVAETARDLSDLPLWAQNVWTAFLREGQK